MLQAMVQAQAAYLKDSFASKKLPDALILLGDYSLVSCNAVSMHTNIDTDPCIAQLSACLIGPVTSKQFPRYPPKALVVALKIVMNNNQMKFGGNFAQQLWAIVMGMLAVSTIAKMFISLHEQKEILPKCLSNLYLYRRFIDDGFIIWKHAKERVL